MGGKEKTPPGKKYLEGSKMYTRRLQMKRVEKRKKPKGKKKENKKNEKRNKLKFRKKIKSKGKLKKNIELGAVERSSKSRQSNMTCFKDLCEKSKKFKLYQTQ